MFISTCSLEERMTLLSFYPNQWYKLTVIGYRICTKQSNGEITTIEKQMKNLCTNIKFTGLLKKLLLKKCILSAPLMMSVVSLKTCLDRNQKMLNVGYF